MRRKKLPYIPVQMSDLDAEYAGKQFIIESTHSNQCGRSRLYELFRDAIIRLLYANFKWEGDITNEEAQHIERRLIENGRVIAARTTFSLASRTPSAVLYGLFGSNNGDSITYDFYGLPLKASISGLNGIRYNIDSPANFVLGYDTTAVNIISEQIPPILTYVDRLAEMIDYAYQAWRVAVETNKHGIVFHSPDEATARQLKRVVEAVSENHPYIITQGTRLSDLVQTIFKGNSGDNVNVYYQNLVNSWSVVLDMLGIENSSAQKRERMVVDEANRNSSLSKCIGADRLEARKRFAVEVSHKLGKHITVRNAYADVINPGQMDQETEEPVSEN